MNNFSLFSRRFLKYLKSWICNSIIKHTYFIVTVTQKIFSNRLRTHIKKHIKVEKTFFFKLSEYKSYRNNSYKVRQQNGYLADKKRMQPIEEYFSLNANKCDVDINR